MKKVISFICVLFFPIVFVPANLSAAEKSSAFEKVKLMPVDETSKDKSLLEFVTSLKSAIKKKDAAFIIAMVPDDIKWSFGAENGKKSFIKFWRLDSDPKNSEIWQELEDIVSMGGVFNKEANSITYPYVFEKFPEKYDAFEYSAITGSDVNVREKPDSKSAVVEKVSYEIVKNVQSGEKPVNETIDGKTYSWKKVQLSSGKTGYVFGKYCYSPIDYRAMFTKIKGKWMMDFMVAGD